MYTTRGTRTPYRGEHADTAGPLSEWETLTDRIDTPSAAALPLAGLRWLMDAGIAPVFREVVSQVLASHRRDPPDQRAQQLLPEHPCLADRRGDRCLLVVPGPPSQHGDCAGTHGDSCHVPVGYPLARRHRGRHSRRDPQRCRSEAFDRHVREGGAGAHVGTSRHNQEGSPCKPAG